MTQWYRVGFYKDRLRDKLGSNTEFFLNLLFDIYLE